jgi:hypothetical protein
MARRTRDAQSTRASTMSEQTRGRYSTHVRVLSCRRNTHRVDGRLRPQIRPRTSRRLLLLLQSPSPTDWPRPSRKLKLFTRRSRRLLLLLLLYCGRRGRRKNGLFMSPERDRPLSLEADFRSDRTTLWCRRRTTNIRLIVSLRRLWSFPKTADRWSRRRRDRSDDIFFWLGLLLLLLLYSPMGLLLLPQVEFTLLELRWSSTLLCSTPMRAFAKVLVELLFFRSVFLKVRPKASMLASFFLTEYQMN